MKNRNAQTIQEMFDQISPRYVLMNTLMTFGRDRSWRKQLIRKAKIRQHSRVLDVATGTGDVLKEAIEQGIELKESVGLDFSAGMLAIARLRLDTPGISWVRGDALALPLKEQQYDAVTSAYLMRNALDIEQALKEQFRILIPGGWVACLDTTPTQNSLLSPLIHFYFQKIVPIMGALIAASKDAYTYLPETTKHFKTAEELKALMHGAGFENVGYQKFMMGTVAVHWGQKPV